MTRPFRGLTLRHPWPYAICHLGKRLENRSFRPSPEVLREGDWFAIHGGINPKSERAIAAASHAMTILRIKGLAPPLSKLMLGEAIMTGIVAVVRYGGIVTAETANDDPWFDGPLAWRLSEVVVLPEAVPCRGMQGLWPVPDDVLPLVREQFKKARVA